MNVVANDAAIWKFEVVSRHKVALGRVSDVLNYDSLIFDFVQFRSVFEALVPGK